MSTRIISEKTNIEMNSVHDLYADRAKNKAGIDVDAPVVLCSDTEPEYIKYWNEYEVINHLPILEVNKESVILELGFGTGRMAKYLIKDAGAYVGIDYVDEFLDTIKTRDDITYKYNEPIFICGSFNDIVSGNIKLPYSKFNRFFISGGVFMYINDSELETDIEKLVTLLDDKCIIYISEPIAISERLTLNNFYSENMKSNYSAIYRTNDEYQCLFEPFYNNGFHEVYNGEFFEKDIKGQKETKQWLYVLKKGC